MMQEFIEAVKNMIAGQINEIHTALPGKIVSFDTKTGLATVLPVMKFRMKDGTTVPYPQITGVPVVLPQSCKQQVTIAQPVKAGDGCLIIIAEHSIEYWLYGQETDTDLSFDLTDAFCIPGLFAAANPVLAEACEQNAVIVDVKGTRAVIRRDEISVTAKNIVLNGDLRVNGTVSAEGIAADEQGATDPENGG